jgi:hypothetical protein
MKTNRDSRIRKNSDTERASRSEEENVKVAEDSKQFVSQENIGKMFVDEFNFEALPNPNKEGDPNFHYFWATTTNPQDTPYRRLRMGYQFVKSEERPDFQHLRMKSGEFEGVISMNEMILMKIPMDLYQALMKEIHHNRPIEQENRLKAEAAMGMQDSRGRTLDIELKEDEGYKDLGKPRRAPSRFE